jgi:hypothetical protein
MLVAATPRATRATPADWTAERPAVAAVEGRA